MTLREALPNVMALSIQGGYTQTAETYFEAFRPQVQHMYGNVITSPTGPWSELHQLAVRNPTTHDIQYMVCRGTNLSVAYFSFAHCNKVREVINTMITNCCSLDEFDIRAEDKQTVDVLHGILDGLQQILTTSHKFKYLCFYITLKYTQTKPDVNVVMMKISDIVNRLQRIKMKFGFICRLLCKDHLKPKPAEWHASVNAIQKTINQKVQIDHCPESNWIAIDRPPAMQTRKLNLRFTGTHFVITFVNIYHGN